MSLYFSLAKNFKFVNLLAISILFLALPSRNIFTAALGPWLPNPPILSAATSFQSISPPTEYCAASSPKPSIVGSKTKRSVTPNPILAVLVASAPV